MEQFEHGGGVKRAALETGLPEEEVLDFSASINPLGPPEGVMQAVRQSLAQICHYPEIDGASLERDLARHHQLEPGCVLAGSGSTELIYTLPRALESKRALLVVPCFSEYERSLRQAGATIDRFALPPEEGFRLDPQRLLGQLHPDTDLVWLASPGNPTGATVPVGDIEALCQGIGEAALVLDEAFIDFVPEASAACLLGRCPNLYILRSLTKFYAIPGLRAGYLLGSVTGISRLRSKRIPWTLSTPALAAASACLAEEDYRRRTLEMIPPLRRELACGLEGLGLEVFPSEANYLLARLPSGHSAG